MIEFLGYEEVCRTLCFASVQSTHFASAKALAIRPALRAAAHLCCSDTRPGDFRGTAAAAGTEGGGESRRLTFMSCVLLLDAAPIACECVAVCIGLRCVIS